MTFHGKKVSRILSEVAGKISSENYTIGDFIGTLSDRSFGFAILVFGLPNAIPIPSVPGFSAVTGFPIIFIALQMLLGRQQLWLPKFVMKKRLSGKAMVYTLNKASSIISRMEIFIFPRYSFMSNPLTERVLAAIIVVLSVVLSMPIIFGNFLPALAICIIAISIIEKDGLMAICGSVLAVFATAVVGSIAFGLGYLVTNLMGFLESISVH